MDRTHILQRRIKRHIPYMLIAVLFTVIAVVLYFKWYDIIPITTTGGNSIERLLEGNKRFASGHPRHPDESLNHRNLVAAGQHPFALVVTCSDSRLSPELIFDQGLGDLFVIRTAGNMISEMEIASIEYAVEHLHVETILVMGHEHCGAIEALMSEKPPHGHVKTIIDSLQQEIEMKDAIAHHDVFNGCIANVQHQVSSIKNTPLISDIAKKRPLSVYGVIYSLENGLVSHIDSFAAHKTE
jgi:carbonic anhydrase